MVETPEALDLTAIEARVLGALLEKQLMTPDGYPLTLNALIAACNQTSNRDPVVRYEPQQVETAVMVLKTKGLARVVHPGSGERATKYRQVADEVLDLESAERAVICALLLRRGAQTLAELKTRTERLHRFASIGEVQAVLEALAHRDVALVAGVERLPGQKEGRWIQLLEADADTRAAASTPLRVTPTSRGDGRLEELEERVAALEVRLTALTEALGDLVDVPDSTDVSERTTEPPE
jgi:uncharacterized protein